MKRLIAVGFVAAVAVVGPAGTANAAPDATGAACFGQVHKSVNTAGAVDGIDNVGQLVKFLEGGQNKNAAARTLFC